MDKEEFTISVENGSGDVEVEVSISAMRLSELAKNNSKSSAELALEEALRTLRSSLAVPKPVPQTEEDMD